MGQRDDFVSSMPFMVSAATMALTTASSVAWTVAGKWVEGIVGEHGQLVRAFGAYCARVGGGEGEENVAGAVTRVAAVAAEPERNFSARRLSCVGITGASVATMTMMEPLRPVGGMLGISLPTGTPAMRSWSRSP